MPLAAAHIILTTTLIDLFRKKYDNKLPLSYVLIGGFAGVLPDIDILVYWLLSSFAEITIQEIHRVYTHTFIIPLIIALAALFFAQKRKLLFVIAFAYAFHVFLDMIFVGVVTPLFPLMNNSFGLDLFGKSGLEAVAEGFDAAILMIWLLHEKFSYKILSFT